MQPKTKEALPAGSTVITATEPVSGIPWFVSLALKAPDRAQSLFLG